MAEDEAGDAVSKRRLADSLRSGNEDAVRHAPGPIGGKKRGLGCTMAEQHRRLARMRRLVDVVVVLLRHVDRRARLWQRRFRQGRKAPADAAATAPSARSYWPRRPLLRWRR